MGANAGTVVLLGDYDYDYFREVSLRDGLRSQEFVVHECQYRDEPISPSLKKLLLLPLFYVRIWRQLRALEDEQEEIDAIILTKSNLLILPIAWLLARRMNALLVYDLFVSLYRTSEMQGYRRSEVVFLYWLERTVFRLPDYLLTETEEFARLYAKLYSIPRERIVGVPIGANETWFHPANASDRPASFDQFTVAYWGNFLPHHGLETVVEAAADLEGEDVTFVLYGDGTERGRIETRVAELGLENVEFRGKVPWEALSRAATGADVALGIFSNHQRSWAGITNKVSEGVAAETAVVTMCSPPIAKWFTHTEDIYLVPPVDPGALADAIRTLRDDPALRNRIATGGRETYESVFSIEHIGELLVDKVPLQRDGANRRRASPLAD